MFINDRRWVLCFTAELLLCQGTSNLTDGAAAPRQKYTSGLVVDVARKIYLDISPTHPMVRSEQCKRKL